MAWIELHDTLPDHDKVLALANMLNMDKDMVVGKLIRLWIWALTNRETGEFQHRDVSTISEIMRYKGSPKRLVEALVECRLLDTDTNGGYKIHRWDDRVCMLLEKREEQRTQSTLHGYRRYETHGTSGYGCEHRGENVYTRGS